MVRLKGVAWFGAFTAKVALGGCLSNEFGLLLIVTVIELSLSGFPLGTVYLLGSPGSGFLFTVLAAVALQGQGATV